MGPNIHQLLFFKTFIIQFLYQIHLPPFSSFSIFNIFIISILNSFYFLSPSFYISFSSYTIIISLIYIYFFLFKTFHILLHISSYILFLLFSFILILFPPHTPSLYSLTSIYFISYILFSFISPC